MEQERSGSAPYAESSRHRWQDSDAANGLHGMSELPEPTALALRAYDALNMGLLVVSHEGVISHYNSAYAQLRNIPLGTMIGQSVAALDRRETIRAFLESGTPRPEKAMDFDMRRNQETLIPIQEGRHMLGCIVVVHTLHEPLPVAAAGGRRRPTRSSTPWAAQYSVADIVGDSAALVRARELACRQLPSTHLSCYWEKAARGKNCSPMRFMWRVLGMTVPWCRSIVPPSRGNCLKQNCLATLLGPSPVR